jgi:uncharacterized protein DUF1573
MIRTLATLLLAVLPTATVVGQEWARKMFDTTSHDFGAVARGAKVEYRFKLSNIYEEDVHITGVRSSCGCTTPQISKDTLKTYEEGSIVATFNTRSFLGQKHATVTVTFDQPYNAEIQLQVSGYIRSDVVLTPGAADLGTVDQGAEGEKKILVSYAGRSDWKIESVKANNPHLVANIKETSRNGGQVSYDLTVRLKPGAPVGYFQDQVMLVTNDAQAGEVPVDVEARIVSQLTVSPASLFLGALKPGQKVTKQVVVQGKKPFRVTAIHCDNAGFEFGPPGEAAKPVHIIPITFTAGEKPGKLSQRIRIETDLGADVSAEVLAQAQIVDMVAADKPAAP